MSDDQQAALYPVWVCKPCGEKHGRKQVGIATWHMGICGVCGQADWVTEPRDFGHLKSEWKDCQK